jgi:hypothetical protein
MATVGAAAVVMVVSGAVAMVQNSQNRDRGSNIAVPLSPGDSQPVKVATTVGLSATTTTIEGSISIGPIATDPPASTPPTQPSSDLTSPSNSVDVVTTSPTNTQVPSNSQGPSISTTPTNTPSPTTQPPATAPPTLLPEPKIWSCGGGSVKYQVTANGLVLLETTPAVGFTASEKKAKGDEITVKFIPNAKNDGRKSSLKIKKSRIVSTSCDDEDFDRRSDSEDSGSTNNNDESADD